MSATAVIDARKAATVFARVRPPRSHVQKGTIRPVVTHRDSLTERPTMATSTLDGVSDPDDELDFELDPDFEEAGGGRYVVFEVKGQQVKGVVIDYEAEGAEKDDGGKVPVVEVELIKPTFTFRDDQKIPLGIGAVITVTGYPVVLANRLRDAKPQPDELIQIIYDGLGGKNGKTKLFRVGTKKVLNPPF